MFIAIYTEEISSWMMTVMLVWLISEWRSSLKVPRTTTGRCTAAEPFAGQLQNSWIQKNLALRIVDRRFKVTFMRLRACASRYGNCPSSHASHELIGACLSVDLLRNPTVFRIYEPSNTQESGERSPASTPHHASEGSHQGLPMEHDPALLGSNSVRTPQR